VDDGEVAGDTEGSLAGFSSAVPSKCSRTADGQALVAEQEAAGQRRLDAERLVVVELLDLLHQLAADAVRVRSRADGAEADPGLDDVAGQPLRAERQDGPAEHVRATFPPCPRWRRRPAAP
jgi:hypothetical protein